MLKNTLFVPRAVNEPVKEYLSGSPERDALKRALDEVYSNVREIPMFIGGKEVKSNKILPIYPPHKISHKIGEYHQGSAGHVNMAIEAALAARESWASLCWKHRASIFLKAASLLAGPYRAKINAATMIGQSKTVQQAEIDSACEIIDFLRFNVQYMEEIYNNQPESTEHEWNRIEQRPLEGFIFALTPFNFTSIAGNLPSAPAMMGNVVVWKASKTQVYSASVLMEVFREAGVPDGVINLVFASGPVIGDIVLNHPDFAGIHFTGSTGVFNGIWKAVGNNIEKYKTYPRLVGETGGKDFVMVHPSANVQQVVTALTRGAFEYQGQKCSAASRAYIPESMWEDVKAGLEADLKSIKMGAPEDFTNFMCAVIDEASFDSLAGFIERAKEDKDADVIIGGNCDKSEGYYIEPTIIQARDPKYITMVEELFGPILTIYVYKDGNYEKTLDLLDETSPYGLTGAVFAGDRQVIQSTTKRLVNAAGNFYINDKPTGAVVGQQPFGGARASGTNDKAGSYLNLLRWVSPRTIKENFLPPVDYRYPYMQE
ncbi:MAG: 1-pyrroline-5-carboxylate dehydrogenase [Bacteroides sp. SM23_62]|nr:MAG: 1-pyrroline-5-carboxylate dehydrogenase [Bacteroides sp. SM23_62]